LYDACNIGGTESQAESQAFSQAAAALLLWGLNDDSGSCFPAGTLVATPRGLFPIEAIKTGDEVWAYDLIQSCWCARLVLKAFVRELEGNSALIAVGDETIESTVFHPFWVVRGEGLAERPTGEHLPTVPEGATTPGRWVYAHDVRVGDELLSRDGRILPVQGIRLQPYRDKVYNFHVQEFESYAVGQNSVLVHNINNDANGPGENSPDGIQGPGSPILDQQIRDAEQEVDDLRGVQQQIQDGIDQAQTVGDDDTARRLQDLQQQLQHSIQDREDALNLQKWLRDNPNP
jgi:hypothetical protein